MDGASNDMADDRIHSVVNLTLLPAILVGANVAAWRALPRPWLALLASVVGTPLLILICHRALPAVTGPILNTLFRDPPR